MLNFFKIISNNKKLEKEETACCYLKQIKQIEKLSAVTQDDFKELYVKTIYNFLDYFSSLNKPIGMSTFIEALDDAILALKKRKGYLLPLAADSEISFRQREEWTFAIFVAALSRLIEEKIRFFTVKSLLPDKAYAWLKRNQDLFSELESYFNNKENNIFSEIIDEF